MKLNVSEIVKLKSKGQFLRMDNFVPNKVL